MTTATPSRTTGHEAWSAALDELEHTLARAEALLHGEAGELPEWTAPTDLGPLPLELATRAHRLLERQRALISETLSASVDVRRKVALVGKLTGISNGRADAPSAYVDVTA